MSQLHAFIDASKTFAHAERVEQIWNGGNALRGASREEFELRVDVFLRWAKEKNRRTEFRPFGRFGVVVVLASDSLKLNENWIMVEFPGR